EDSDPLANAVERPVDLTLELAQDGRRVLIGALPDPLGLKVSPIQDPPALLLGRLGQAAFLDQEGGLLLCPGHDRLGFFLSLFDDPLPLRVDPLGRPDLLRDGNPELVDQPKCRVLVQDDIAGEGQLLPAGDQVLESRDEEDDVDWTGPPWTGDGERQSRCVGRIIAPAQAPRAGPPRPDSAPSPARRHRRGRSRGPGWSSYSRARVG